MDTYGNNDQPRTVNSRFGLILVPDDLDPTYQYQEQRSGPSEIYTSDIHEASDSLHCEIPTNQSTRIDTRSQSCPSSNFYFYELPIKKKSVCITYALTFFLGIFGAHHFYLGRPKFGTLYIFTAGLLGLGYVVDLVRVPWLVENANLEILHPQLRGRKYLGDAFLLWLPPFGLLGFHHFYLGNGCIACVYMMTAGAFVLGWIIDICIIPMEWMKNANAEYRHVIEAVHNARAEGYREQIEIPPPLSTDDCAVMTSTGIASTGVVLSPPPYTEFDELEPPDNPPSYQDVIAMDALESHT